MSACLKGLAHIGIYTPDAQASAEFYKKLGFTQDACSTPGATLVFMSCGSCLLELIQPKEAEGLGDGVVAHVAIACQGIEELARKYQQMGLLTDPTVSINNNILNGVKNLFFRGPSGESIELFETL